MRQPGNLEPLFMLLPATKPLRQFLEHDRHVLRFTAAWDDTGTEMGERRPFSLHYFLGDDTIEVRVIQARGEGWGASACCKSHNAVSSC